MKTQIEIERRLIKLTNRHKKRHLGANLSKLPENCKYNYLHEPNTLEYNSSLDDSDVVKISEDKPVRICMYGSENPAKWNGDICDTKEVSSGCGYFCPKKSADQLSAEFNEMITDDGYTIENYSDVAALQWVVNDRTVNLKNHSFFVYYVLLVYSKLCMFFKSV